MAVNEADLDGTGGALASSRRRQQVRSSTTLQCLQRCRWSCGLREPQEGHHPCARAKSTDSQRSRRFPRFRFRRLDDVLAPGSGGMCAGLAQRLPRHGAGSCRECIQRHLRRWRSATAAAAYIAEPPAQRAWTLASVMAYGIALDTPGAAGGPRQAFATARTPMGGSPARRSME